MIYLDSAAMAKPLEVAIEAYNNAPFGNPSSEHMAGHVARVALENARYTIAKCLDCEPHEVYFTSTATEAAAWAIKSLEEDGSHVIPSAYEHHAISENTSFFANRRVEFARMLANNETGEIFPAPVCENDEYWICDATAAVGHISVSFKRLGCDYLIADAIKFGGVSGASILIAKKGAPLSPMIRGGGQERGMRSGTENVPAICAMAAALEWQCEHKEENIMQLAMMRQIMFKMLSEIPDHKWNTPFDKPCLPHILNVSFDGVDAHALVLHLGKEGIMASAGAACSNGLNEPSHVIMAMYRDEARARSAIRISFGVENTPDEIVEAGQKIKEAVAHLRSLS